MHWRSVSVFISFLIVASAAPLSLLNAGNLSWPSQDPFYTPREGYESLQNGEVINHRKITHPYGLFTLQLNIEAAYQFLVRSEDSFGNATYVVTTLLVPHNADPTKILSYQVAIDSPNADCAPSYAMQYGSDASTWITAQLEVALLEGGLYEGWYVVVPDFLGPKGAFAAGIQAGHATLDSLKAIIQSGDLTGVDSNAEIALWGYSGGSQPTMWAPSLAPSYAPDLNIIGAAAGGILVDPYHIAEVSIDTPWAGLVVEAILGLANEYPTLMDYVKENIYPEAQPAFFEAKNRCLVGNLAAFVETSWDDLSSKGAGILDSSVVTDVTSANNLLDLDAKPNVPFFFYNSKHDEIIPHNDTDGLYDKWCSEGVSIEYRQDSLSEHVTQAIFGAGDALEWLKDRFSGKKQSGCTKINSLTNLANLDSVTGLYALGKEIYDDDKKDPVGPSSPPKLSPSKSSPKNSTTSSNSTTFSNSTVSRTSSTSTSTSTSTSSSLLGSILGSIF